MTAAELAEKLEALSVKAVAAPISCSPQNGAPGHCFVAQVWGEVGDSVAQFDPTENPDCASATAELLTFIVNNATTIAARLRSMEEALKEAHEAINLAMTIAQGRFPATARKAPLEVLADAERKARAALAGVANGQV